MFKKLVLPPFIILAAACAPPSAELSWQKPDTEVLNCADYHSHATSDGLLYNNVWNKHAAGNFAWQQCLVKHPSAIPTKWGWSWSWPVKSKDIFAYPQIKIGQSPWAPESNFGQKLPKKLQHIQQINLSHQVTVSTNGQHNLTYTMWLTHSGELGPEVNKSLIAAEVMIWTYASKKHMSPAGKRIANFTYQGNEWQVWAQRDWHDTSGKNENKWVHLTFKNTEHSLKSNFDALPLLQHGVELRLLNPEWFVADVELGTEINSGAGVLWLDSFEVQITP